MLNKTLSTAAGCFIVFYLLFVPIALGKVTVQVGPTVIPGGEALAPDDITITNDKMAISIAVGTFPPWGVPKGGIIDAAAIKNGQIGMDRLTLLDFLPDKWAEWAVLDATVTVAEQSDAQAVITVERTWRGNSIISTYTINDG
ncbi:MAG: hypothetical protein ACRCTY_03435, partial [Candidatus Adiutrix sp.]